MSKKNLANASDDAMKAAREMLGENTAAMITGTMELKDKEEQTPKYTIVKGVPMIQYGGSTVKTNGVLDETCTVIAVAVARPGNPNYQNATQNGLARTLMYGDVAIYSFDNKNQKIGIRIMPTKSWMVMQSKDSAGAEKQPFIRTPWDVRQSVVSTTGSMQPPTMDRQLKQLADVAINIAAVECAKRIAENKPSQSQENYIGAIRASAVMAGQLAQTTKSTSKSNTQSTMNAQITQQAAELLADE